MYLYETHLHTMEASLCAHTKASDYIPYYLNLGYHGIFITDHFFNGNTSIQAGSWEERVLQYTRPYHLAKEAGDRLGLQVFFGVEFNYQGDEFLLYGIDEEFLLSHEELPQLDPATLFALIDSVGGLMVQAHPFRERDYLNTIYLNPSSCHAMEAYNAFNRTNHNYNAELYCKEHEIFMTAGSDMHKAGTLPPDRHFGMEFEEELRSAMDYVSAIKARKGRMHIPGVTRNLPDSIHTELPVVTRSASV